MPGQRTIHATMSRRKASNVEVSEAEVSEQDDERPPPSSASLFAEVAGAKGWDHLLLYRIDPAEEEGFLVQLPISATEHDIRGRFGGGRFRVQARDAAKKIKATREITIAGDPVFLSKAATNKWRRAQGLPLLEEVAAAQPAGIGITDIMGLLQTMQAASTAQMQQFAQMQAAEQARRENERRADDERRREEDRRREDQMRREAEESRAREREYFSTMINVIATAKAPAAAPASPPIEVVMGAFTQGLDLAQKLRPPAPAPDDDEEEGEEQPPATSGDPVAQMVQGSVRGIIDALVSRATGTPAPAPAPAALPPVPDDGNAVTLTGELASKVRAMVAAAQASGRDPNAVLDKAVTVASKAMIEKPNAAAAAAAASAPTSSSSSSSSSSSAPDPAKQKAARTIMAAVDARKEANGTAASSSPPS